MKLIEHLEELRKRIITLLALLLAFFVLGMFFSKTLFRLIQHELLTSSVNLVVLTPLEYFMTVLRLGLYCSVILTTPFLAYELAAFIRPAVGKKHFRALVIMFLSFLVLYAAGISFAILLFVPLTFYFLTPFAPSIGIANLWSLSSVVNFLFITVYSTGLIFQIPLVMIALTKLHLVQREWFKSKRKYVYVIIFIIAAAVTPGVDVVTQLLVALPMMLLYEIGMILMLVFRD